MSVSFTHLSASWRLLPPTASSYNKGSFLALRSNNRLSPELKAALPPWLGRRQHDNRLTGTLPRRLNTSVTLLTRSTPRAAHPHHRRFGGKAAALDWPSQSEQVALTAEQDSTSNCPCNTAVLLWATSACVERVKPYFYCKNKPTGWHLQGNSTAKPVVSHLFMMCRVSLTELKNI